MNPIEQALKNAQDALNRGDLDAADAFTREAETLKRMAAVKASDPAATITVSGVSEQPARLPFEPVAGGLEGGGSTTAIKAIEAAYIKKYGKVDDAVEQIYSELYGTRSYAALRAVKMADTERYLRTGHGDHRLAKQVLLAPEQVLAAVISGVPVAEGNYNIKATMVEAQDVLGGYLVPEELNQDMIQRLPGMTVVRKVARKFNTSRDALAFMVRTGGTSRYIGAIRSKQTSESPSAGQFDTNATFGKIVIPVHVNLSKVPVSKSLLEDSGVNILNEVLMPEFSTEAALTEDAQFLGGSGANEPQGILNGFAANGAPFNADVTTRNSGAAAALTFDPIVKAPWDLKAQYRSKRNPSTQWAFSSAAGAALAELKGGDGHYLWTEMHGNNAQGNPDTLRGWGYSESEALASVAANTYPIIFGDFSGYRIVDRVGMSVQRYEDSATADSDSVVFFCRRRYGGQLAEGYKFVVIKVAA